MHEKRHPILSNGFTCAKWFQQKYVMSFPMIMLMMMMMIMMMIIFIIISISITIICTIAEENIDGWDGNTVVSA